MLLLQYDPFGTTCLGFEIKEKYAIHGLKELEIRIHSRWLLKKSTFPELLLFFLQDSGRFLDSYFFFLHTPLLMKVCGKKYILRQAVRKNNFPHMWWIFPWGKKFFHTLSLIKGCEEKKSKCVENNHSKLEITRKIKKMYLEQCLNFAAATNFM